MEMETGASLPNYKWKILDYEKAKEAKVMLLDIDEKNVFLKIDVKDIPQGLSVIDWIETLEKSGIIFCQK